MSEILFGLIVGLAFALSGLAFFGILIGIGEIIDWYQGRSK